LLKHSLAEVEDSLDWGKCNIQIEASTSFIEHHPDIGEISDMLFFILLTRSSINKRRL
jgi:hypothetical protein